MKNYGIIITYLFNSGFIVETEKHLLLFDYYKDQTNQGSQEQSKRVEKKILATDKKVFIFVSHRHKDHFNPVILEWSKLRAEINYFLSDDIKPVQKNEGIKLVAPYQQLEVDDLNTKTYGSTDEGVSFLVKVDELTLFHAGDLNWWYWWDDPEEEIKMAEHRFKAEIEKMKGERIDLAFFPVDPRLEHNYSIGGEYFIQQLHPKVLIPMHFGTDYEILSSFVAKVQDFDTKVINITSSPQEILL